jgi:hypothetical protein
VFGQPWRKRGPRPSFRETNERAFWGSDICDLKAHGIRLGAVIGVAPSAIALAKEAGTSRVRKAISIPAGRPSTGRTYLFGINISPSELGSNGQRGPTYLQFGESQSFVEKTKLQSKHSSIEIRDRGDLVDVQNCSSELHCHMIRRPLPIPGGNPEFFDARAFRTS